MQPSKKRECANRLTITLTPLSPDCVSSHEVWLRLNGEPVGYAQLERRADLGVLEQVTIFEQYRRRGFAQILLEALHHICDTDLQLMVYRDNAPAIDLYRKCGFEIRDACDQFLEGVLAKERT